MHLFEVLSLEGMAGIEIDSLRLDVRDDAVAEEDNHDAVGPVLGARATLHVRPLLDLYGQWTKSFEDFTDLDTTLETLDATLRLGLARHLAPTTGWRWWYYTDDRHGSGLDFDLAGPHVGLEIHF